MATELVFIRAVGTDGVLRKTNDVVGTAAGEAKYYRVMMTGAGHFGKVYFYDRDTYDRYRYAEDARWCYAAT